MKKKVRCLLAIFTVAFAGGPSYADVTSWHDLSAAQRTEKVVQTAYLDLGRNVGKECKPWVQIVVSKASIGHVKVPLNRGNFLWDSDPDGHVVGASIPIQRVKRGDIIQMEVKGRSEILPHTAIVVSRSSTGVKFIESNYHKDTTVRLRTLTFEKFNSELSAPGRYSVYKVQ